MPQLCRMATLVGALLAGLCLAATRALAESAALFEAGAGLPSTQGWTTLSIGSPGSESLSGNLYTLDSTGTNVDTWGQARFSPLALDPAGGYTLNFALRVVAESHSSADRGGFSMLFVGQDPRRSIELAFTSSELFAYELVAGQFVHGSGALVQTGSTLLSYTLQVSGTQYALSLQGQPLFGGTLQDYTAQGLPYTLPNFVFFGDDTSSGAARVEISHILLATAVPEPASAACWLVGLALLGWRMRHRAAA